MRQEETQEDKHCAAFLHVWQGSTAIWQEDVHSAVKERTGQEKESFISSMNTLGLQGCCSHLTVERNHLVGGKIWQFAGHFN